MPNRIPEDKEILDSHHESRMADVATSTLATSVGYDSTAQRTTAHPVQQKVMEAQDGTATSEELPDIPNIPVMFPGSPTSGFFIRWPVGDQDPGVLSTLISDASAYLDSSDPTNTAPADTRRHYPGNSVFTPATPNPPTPGDGSDQDMVISTASFLRLGGVDAEHLAGDGVLILAVLKAILTSLASATAPSGGGAVIYGTPLPVSLSITDVAFTKVKGK